MGHHGAKQPRRRVRLGGGELRHHTGLERGREPLWQQEPHLGAILQHESEKFWQQPLDGGSVGLGQNVQLFHSGDMRE